MIGSPQLLSLFPGLYANSNNSGIVVVQKVNLPNLRNRELGSLDYKLKV
jgi:hypothetical protein